MLITDCNLAVTAATDLWVALETLNAPLQKKLVPYTSTLPANLTGGYEHPVFAIAALNVSVAGNSLIIQTVKGLDEPFSGQSITTKYERVSALELGMEVGTDWSSWVKIG